MALPRVRRRGNALAEYILTLPILFFCTGLTIYMATAMMTKREALVKARHVIWHSAGRGHWTGLDLGLGWAPDEGANEGHRPRGTGEELARLRPEVEPETLQQVSNDLARDYWHRIWGNLPGRHETVQSSSFERTEMFDFLGRTARADHFRDSSPWHFGHLDAWEIARSGPLRVIYDAVRENLEEDVAEHFQHVREDVLRRWFHSTPEDRGDDEHGDL